MRQTKKKLGETKNEDTKRNINRRKRKYEEVDRVRQKNRILPRNLN
jgi:hypothetical protein